MPSAGGRRGGALWRHAGAIGKAWRLFGADAPAEVRRLHAELLMELRKAFFPERAPGPVAHELLDMLAMLAGRQRGGEHASGSRIECLVEAEPRAADAAAAEASLVEAERLAAEAAAAAAAEAAADWRGPHWRMPVRPNAPRVAAEPVELAAVQADGAAQRPSCEPFDEALKAWATSDMQCSSTTSSQPGGMLLGRRLSRMRSRPWKLTWRNSGP